MQPDPIAFLSYARDDDRFSEGFISDFRDRLMAEVRNLRGAGFEIFLDHKSIRWGEHWEQRIRSTLNASSFLIPFVTPNLLTSLACREEIREFLQLEARQGRDDLILPIYFVDVTHAAVDADDEIRAVLDSRQRWDLRSFQGQKASAPAVRQEISKLARAIAERIHEDGSRAAPRPPPPARRVVNRPPDLVPAEVRDRVDVVDRLRSAMDETGTVLVQLAGEPGVGKTAIITEVMRTLPVAVTFNYLSAGGYLPVNVLSLLEALADTHPDPLERDRLIERIHTGESDSLEKLDDVLAALGQADVWLVVDDAEALLDPDGEMRDTALEVLLAEMAGQHHHRVRILLVTTRRFGEWVPRTVEVEPRLPGRHLRQFLRDLEASRPVGLLPTSPWDWERFEQATDHRPRAAELLFGIMASRPMPLTDVLSALSAADSLPALLVNSLGDVELRVLQTLALLGRPVESGTLRYLLADVAPADRLDAAVTELAARRIIRDVQQWGCLLYYLPEDEAGPLRTRLTDKTTLCRRAARHLESRARERVARGAIHRVEDLAEFFQAIELYLTSNDEDKALDLMNEIDQWYLKGWGHTDALRLYLTSGLEDRLPDLHSRLVAKSLRARALMQHGHLSESIRILYAAGAENRLLEDPDNQLVLLIQLAGYLFIDGRPARAAEVYREAIRLAGSADPLGRLAHAWVGLALCQTEIGAFADALSSVEAARAVPGTHTADVLDDPWLDVQLSLTEARIALELGHDQRSLQFVRDARRTAGNLPAGAPQADALRAQCDEHTAQVWLFRDLPERALRFARDAYRLVERARNPDLCRITGVTLAVSHLALGEVAQALVVADAAAHYARRRHGVGPSAVRGVAAFRIPERRAEAGPAFAQAERMCRELRDKEPENYQVLEAHGLVLAGLVLTTGGTDDSAAVRAYQAAIERSDVPGAHRRRRLLFTTLVHGRSDDVLGGVRELLWRS